MTISEANKLKLLAFISKYAVSTEKRVKMSKRRKNSNDHYTLKDLLLKLSIKDTHRSIA